MAAIMISQEPNGDTCVFVVMIVFTATYLNRKKLEAEQEGRRMNRVWLTASTLEARPQRAFANLAPVADGFASKCPFYLFHFEWSHRKKKILRTDVQCQVKQR